MNDWVDAKVGEWTSGYENTNGHVGWMYDEVWNEMCDIVGIIAGNLFIRGKGGDEAPFGHVESSK